MVRSGAALLEKNKSKVDALNVFPVPDGDTGTNMYLTLFSAVKEAEKNQNDNVGQVGKAVSMGSLMGARGNSGVILSQVFRGIAKELDSRETIDAKILAAALQSGSETAYKAVMKPVEGTILTVVRETARAANNAAKSNADIVAVMQESLEAGKRMLERTPQMLPILKEAGVVDAGGQGFLYFYEGMIQALGAYAEDFTSAPAPSIADETSPGDQNLTYQYCTEVLIRGTAIDVEAIRDSLFPIGDSLLVVGEPDLVKVHVHSNHPGKVLETCLTWGSLHDVKIDNMAEEAEARLESLESASKLKKVGVIAVGQGEGWIQMFDSLGVDKVVDGGQTMNPSTEDLVNAVAEVEAESVIILPNNKNIIMAALQAEELSEKPVEVVETNSVTEAIAAMVAFDEEKDLASLAAAMKTEIAKVKTGEITIAVRDSAVNGLKIKAGDYIGIINDVIKMKGGSSQEVVLSILELIAPGGDLISLFYGAEVEEKEAGLLKAKVAELYPLHDVELHFGGQPFYHYLISVE
jgi:DAK2 domain fusion protein YloV